MRLVDAEPIEKFITDGLNSQEKLYGWVGVKILAEVHYAPTVEVSPAIPAHWEIIEHWATNDADKVSETIYLRCSKCRRQIKEDRCHLTDLKRRRITNDL